MKVVAFITVNLNLPEDTISVVSDFKKQVLPKNCSRVIIVVDNGSTDGSLTKIKAAHKDIILLPQRENIGVAGGYNAGIRFALKGGAEYIIVANNDLIMNQKTCTNFLIESLEKDKKNGAATPLIYFAPGFVYHKNRYTKSQMDKVIWYAGGLIDWDNVLMSHRGVDIVDKKQFKEGETDFLTGAFIIFKSAVLLEVGIFNEKYFAYLEDVEISERLKSHGYKLLFVPKAVIAHKVSQTSGGIGGNWNDYYITRNRMQFGLRYAKTRTKIALIREAARLLFTGRPYQKEAVKDFFLFRLGRKKNLPR